MLNREGNENGIKINDLISKKANLHVQHAFFSFFAVVLDGKGKRRKKSVEWHVAWPAE